MEPKLIVKGLFKHPTSRRKTFPTEKDWMKNIRKVHRLSVVTNYH